MQSHLYHFYGKMDSNKKLIEDTAERLDIKDSKQDSLILANKRKSDDQDIVIDSKADQSYVDGENLRQTTMINNNRDYYEQRNTELNHLVVTNISTTERLDKKNAEQDAVIIANDNRVTNEVTRIDKKDADQDTLINKNAQNISNNTESIITTNNTLSETTSRLDKKDAEQDVAINTNTDNITVNKNDITNLKATDETLQQQINEANKSTESRITVMQKYQSAIDNTQNINISQNSENIERLGYRMDDLEKHVDGNAANAVALSQLPEGDGYLGIAVGNHNGQSALALGYSGTFNKDNGGTTIYKMGGAWSKEGGASIGGGIGFKFK